MKKIFFCYALFTKVLDLMISDMCLTYGDMNRFITSAEYLFGIIAEKKYEPKVSAGPLGEH